MAKVRLDTQGFTGTWTKERVAGKMNNGKGEVVLRNTRVDDPGRECRSELKYWTANLTMILRMWRAKTKDSRQDQNFL